MFFLCFVLTRMGRGVEEHINCSPHVSLRFRGTVKKKPCEGWAAERPWGRFDRWTDSGVSGTERGQRYNIFSPDSHHQ